jgi:glycosyltransferase involved in cell wall biosynthesis
MLKIAVFNSHPIQHFAPWWREIAQDPSVFLKVFYYSQANVKSSCDHEFGTNIAYDVDLLGGYDYSFLPRQWPLSDSETVRWHLWNKGIRSALRERRWDGVLIFGYNMLNNWRILRACRRMSIPVFYFSDSNARIMYQRSVWKLLIRGFLVRRFFRHIYGFLSPSSSNAEYLRRSGVPSVKIVRCPYPVDVPRFVNSVNDQGPEERIRLRKRYGLEPDDFVVVFCGKLLPRKRPLDLVEAVRAIGDPRIKALFVGTGVLEEEVRKFGGEWVRMAGFVNQKEIPRILAAGDLGVLPSEYEPHGQVVAESLVVGVPVVCNNLVGAQGPDDILRHGENGFAYPSGDIKELSRLIAHVKSDPELRMRLSRRAVEIGRTQSAQSAAEILIRCVRGIRRAEGRQFERPQPVTAGSDRT